MRNANSVYLNGRPFREDLEKTLGRPVRMANDANCLALSEAMDGAAAGAGVVFAAILGTGCGGGLVANGKLIEGRNGVAGEWAGDGGATLLYLHGGAFFAGSPRHYRPISAAFASLGFNVFTPAYRLAPRHPFP